MHELVFDLLTFRVPADGALFLMLDEIGSTHGVGPPSSLTLPLRAASRPRDKLEAGLRRFEVGYCIAGLRARICPLGKSDFGNQFYI